MTLTGPCGSTIGWPLEVTSVLGIGAILTPSAGADSGAASISSTAVMRILFMIGFLLAPRAAMMHSLSTPAQHCLSTSFISTARTAAQCRRTDLLRYRCNGLPTPRPRPSDPWDLQHWRLEQPSILPRLRARDHEFAVAAIVDRLRRFRRGRNMRFDHFKDEDIVLFDPARIDQLALEIGVAFVDQGSANLLAGFRR